MLFNHITNLVAELLYKHDCVIVPNFGGFVARTSGSHFSKGNSLLNPASKQLLFNKNLIHQDGLLVSALMQSKSFSYDEANQHLTDYKDYIQSILQAKKRFELNNIGLLYMDNENILRFEPKAHVNFLIDAFGFEPIVAKELPMEALKPLVEKHFEDRRVVIESLPPVKQKKSFAKMATLAVGIPATLAFILFAAYSKPMQPLLQSSLNPFYTPAKTYKASNSKYNKLFMIDEVVNKPLIADANGYATFQLSTESAVLVASSNEVSANVAVAPVVKSMINRSTSFKGKYQVVLGCFGMMSNAEKMVAELQKKDVSASVSGTNAKGLHVVSCGAFNNIEEAHQLLTVIKTNYPNAWVMTK